MKYFDFRLGWCVCLHACLCVPALVLCRGWLTEDRGPLLSIENPLDLAHDVGRNSFAFNRIQRAFQHSHQSLIAAMIDVRHCSLVAAYTVASCLVCAVSRCCARGKIQQRLRYTHRNVLTAGTICFVHVAWTKSVREKDWRCRKRGMQAP
jgi:hypothetical protein